MKMSILSLSILLAVSAFAGTPNDDIRAVLQAQQDAWNRGDIDAFMNGYWRSDQTVFIGGDARRGWQNVLDYYKTKYSDREKMGTLTFSDFEITPLGSDAALVLGSWKLDFAGGKNVHGKTTLIFRHFPEGWRIVHDHSSAAP
jgi:L-asparaginase / beta-aspartyl-peptidase